MHSPPDHRPIGFSGSEAFSKPLHHQVFESLLKVSPLTDYVESLLEKNQQLDSNLLNEAKDLCRNSDRGAREADQTLLYNFAHLKKDRKWLKDVLLELSSDSSDDEVDNDSDKMTDEEYKFLLRRHQHQRHCQFAVHVNSELQRYKYYSSGLLSVFDKYPEHQKQFVPEQKRKRKSNGTIIGAFASSNDACTSGPMQNGGRFSNKTSPAYSPRSSTKLRLYRTNRQAKLSLKEMQRRERNWLRLVREDIPKAYAERNSIRSYLVTLAKKCAKEVTKEVRRRLWEARQAQQDASDRARLRILQTVYQWRDLARLKRQRREMAQRLAEEKRRALLLESQQRETKRKLCKALTELDLFTICLSGSSLPSSPAVLDQLSTEALQSAGLFLPGDSYDEVLARADVIGNVETALKAFYAEAHVLPGIESDGVVHVGEIYSTKYYPLHKYQIEGVDWLLSLSRRGLSGILADDSGLGKRVQIMAYLSCICVELLKSTESFFLVLSESAKTDHWYTIARKFFPLSTKIKVNCCVDVANVIEAVRMILTMKKETETCLSHLLICNFDVLTSPEIAQVLSLLRWTCVVFDSPNMAGPTWHLQLSIPHYHRIMLFKFPQTTDPKQIISLLHFVIPHPFVTNKELISTLSGNFSLLTERPENFASLAKCLSFFLLQRNESVHRHFLPILKTSALSLPQTQTVHRRYDSFVDDLAVTEPNLKSWVLSGPDLTNRLCSFANNDCVSGATDHVNDVLRQVCRISQMKLQVTIPFSTLLATTTSKQTLLPLLFWHPSSLVLRGLCSLYNISPAQLWLAVTCLIPLKHCYFGTDVVIDLNGSMPCSELGGIVLRHPSLFSNLLFSSSGNWCFDLVTTRHQFETPRHRRQRLRLISGSSQVVKKSLKSFTLPSEREFFHYPVEFPRIACIRVSQACRNVDQIYRSPLFVFLKCLLHRIENEYRRSFVVCPDACYDLLKEFLLVQQFDCLEANSIPLSNIASTVSPVYISNDKTPFHWLSSYIDVVVFVDLQSKSPENVTNDLSQLLGCILHKTIYHILA